MSLVAYKLLERIRKAGGEVRLGRGGKLQHRNVPPALKLRLERNYYRVQTWLADAAYRPTNWRQHQSPLGNVYLTPACSTCSKWPFPHYHGDPGPEANFKLNGTDPFEAMKQLVRKYKGEQSQ